MPIWRTDYCDKARNQTPVRSVIIGSENTNPTHSMKHAPRWVQPVVEQK